MAAATTVTSEQLQRVVEAFSGTELPGPEAQEPVRWAPRAWKNRLGDLDGISNEFVKTMQIPHVTLLEWGRAPFDSIEERRGFFSSIMAWGYGRARGGPMAHSADAVDS